MTDLAYGQDKHLIENLTVLFIALKKKKKSYKEN